jgi:hypothetical protein
LVLVVKSKLNAQNGCIDIPRQSCGGYGATSDFVELLGLAGLGQVEIHPATPVHVDLEARRIFATGKKKQTSAVPIFPQLRRLEQCNLLLAKFIEPGELPERL